ncbi:hypothetical protein O3M35_001225 [Rhynocoris fuscipes]|uniref:Uncharacterized protein n=1 Tax=Rhynocoris fuscipes TaxID=488301 RepID=A0AAW1DPM7_9HEMI
MEVLYASSAYRFFTWRSIPKSNPPDSPINVLSFENVAQCRKYYLLYIHKATIREWRGGGVGGGGGRGGGGEEEGGGGGKKERKTLFCPGKNP